MNIDFHRLIEAMDSNRLILIDYIDYLDCLLMIYFHRLGTPGLEIGRSSLQLLISVDPFRTQLYVVFRVRVHCFFCIVFCVHCFLNQSREPL